MIRPRDPLPSLAPAASRDFPALRRVLPFTLPYRMRMAGAMLALLVSSATVLGLGQGLRRLVDEGFKSGDVATLDRAVLLLIGVVVLLAGSTFCRFYLVSWIGERVVADIRRAVFDRVIALSPAYFEVHRTGDILSRLTTDTTLLQTVIGSAVSQALRNALLLVGGLVMLAVTSIKLTRVVLLIVPVVVVPILRPAGAAAVARQPGRDRRLWGSCRRDDQRHPHSAGLHPRGASDASRRRQGCSGRVAYQCPHRRVARRLARRRQFRGAEAHLHRVAGAVLGRRAVHSDGRILAGYGVPEGPDRCPARM